MNERSARALLGVSPSATTGQISRAYRHLAFLAHPDRGGDPAAFKRLVEAKCLLLAQTKNVRRPVVSSWLVAEHVSPQTRLNTMVGNRRQATAMPKTRGVQFGDVLAEKLAAA